MSDLSVVATRVGDRHILNLSGELTVQTVDELAEPAMAALVDVSVRRLVVDLAAVRFIDSTGIGSLVSLNATASDVSAQLVLQNPTPRIVELLRLINMDNVFSVDPPIARER